MNLSIKAASHVSEQFCLHIGNDMGTVVIDSSRVKASGVLLFNWEGKPGVYRLSDRDGHLVDFMMEKSNLSFEIKGNFDDTEFIFESGDKNNQFQYYISEFEYYNQEAKRIGKEYAEANMNDKKGILKSYKETQKTHKNLVKDLWAKKDDNWSLKLALSYADMMPNLNKKNKSRFFVDQYFQYFDFNDSLTVGTVCFYNKIDHFFKTDKIQSLIELGKSKEIDLMIQQIFWLSETNKYAQECLVNFLMNNFPENKYPNLNASVIRTYKLANSCEYVMATKGMRARLEKAKSFKTGSLVSDFTLQNCLNINVESLTKVNSDLTLLVAWSAYCDASVELLDQIRVNYQSYQEKGLEVVAVCIDRNIAAWENYVNNKGYNWVNACDRSGLKGEFADAYNVTTTPSMFLISSDLKLKAKPITFSQLNRAILKCLY